MDPSEVRHRIVSQHAEIVARLAEINTLLKQGSAAARQLRQSCVALLPLLVNHLYLEEVILTPALEEADAWGDVRTRILGRHHERQRRDLLEVVEHFSRAPLDESRIVALARLMVAHLEEDFAEEDRTVLHPSILRDDVIAIGAMGG